MLQHRALLGPLLAAATALAAHDPAVASQDAADPWPAARAVLESRCLTCHGGDQVKSALRFATRTTLLEGGDRGPVVDLGDPQRSRLLEVIGYENPELAMPPSGQLPADEIQTLTRWVEAGAPWPDSARLADPDAHREHALDLEAMRDWWAYRPLAEPSVPEDVHPIDHLLEARRREAGLSAAPQATAAALVRRASFDLLGLPPAPEEVTAFEARVAREGLDAAWSALIDGYLASPHHGEQWGRHWLDLVRYAESNGYERDSTKANAWRYRDYVVRAHASDKPYDQFLLEQLAGDQLGLEGAAADEARIATGYYRLMVWDDEPADRLQARADEIADVVDTTSQVFLASTLGCARCHDHKADPFSQRDYYAVTAWFNHITPFGEGHHPDFGGGGPTLDLPDAPGPGVMRVEERDAELAEVEARLIEDAIHLDHTTPDTEPRVPLVHDARSANPTRWAYRLGDAPAGWETPGFDDAGWSTSPGGFGTPGTHGAPVATEWQGEVIHLRSTFGLESIPRELTLTFRHDEEIDVWLNGQHVFHRGGYRVDHDEHTLPPHARDRLVVGRNVLAVRCRNHSGGQYVDVGLRTGRGPGYEERVLEHLRHWARHPAHVERHPDIALRVERRNQLLAMPTTEPYPALVVKERGGRPPVQHVLGRGSAHAPGDAVAPGVPEVLLADSVSGPTWEGETSDGRRLAFARWLVGDAAFLTARVQANRLWQFHFGRGLCRSPGDFGRLGVEPTHPELLDHLAAELIRRDWSLHSMHRYLMSSAAYRMASLGAPGDLEADPRNDLYHRFDPRRLRAEEFRDAVLASNGTLNRDLYGPSVRPPLSREVLATSSQPHNVWPASADPRDARRRSIYVHVKRSLRHPLLGALDQPDPDLPCPDRFPTNVPTQALITLNGDFVQGAAADLVASLDSEGGSMVASMMERALGRAPDPSEVARNEAFVARLRDEHGLDHDQALRAFAVGLYNRNEFLWID